MPNGCLLRKTTEGAELRSLNGSTTKSKETRERHTPVVLSAKRIPITNFYVRKALGASAGIRSGDWTDGSR